ncbi:hypothetical protein [Liquorilactobacillus nagelii]|nr:hypothetical protein [Liquorilactobacillus nagelii]
MKDWEAYVTNEIKRKRWVDSCDYSTLCKSSGVSCYQTEAEAKNAFEAMKKRSPAFRKKFNGIFSVDISPVDGVLAETSNPKNTYRHFTFWINNKSKITTNNYTCIKE